LRTSKGENLDTLVQVTLSGRDIPLVKVYPHLNSFDNGLTTDLDKRTGGLCGNWKKNNSDHVPECKLYYKNKKDDACINESSDTRINEVFKTYWR
jgi:hypothetical protein